LGEQKAISGKPERVKNVLQFNDLHKNVCFVTNNKGNSV